jgi:hypothetical protein
MIDLAKERDTFLRLARDARERGLLVVAEMYQRAALKLSLQRINRIVAGLRRE